MAKRNSNIRKFKKRFSLNVGYLVFAIIFVYILVSVIIYANSTKTIVYEVDNGSLSVDNVYNGFIVRDETVVKSQYSGSINYFLKKGHKAGVDTLVCSVDETGRVAELINNNAKKQLSDEGMQNIRDTILSVTTNYSDNRFSQVYNISDNILNNAYEISNSDLLETLDEYIESTESKNFFHEITPSNSSVISYTVDGYESATEDSINSSLFDENDSYSYNDLTANKIVNKGDSIYKTINSVNWCIYIPLTNNEAHKLSDDSAVNITFSDKKISCRAGFEVITKSDGSYGKISLNKYIVNFIDNRYVKVELGEDGISGLKIPTSALITRNSYSIPKECLSDSGLFLVKKYDTNGNVTLEPVSPTIYYSDEYNHYVSLKDFKSGDVITYANSDQVFVVGIIQELNGVYCVNKGYTEFKAVVIIDNNDDYYIVKKGTENGISRYDHIILDHSSIKEDQIIG